MLSAIYQIFSMSRKTQPFSVYPSDDVVTRDRSVKRDKIQSSKKTRDSSNTRSPPERDKASTLYTKKVKTTNARSTSSGQQTTRPIHKDPSYNSFKGKEEPWGQLLKKSSKEQSTFSNFDPLRTLHFLIKELECRIKNDIPGKSCNCKEIETDLCFVRFAFAANCT